MSDNNRSLHRTLVLSSLMLTIVLSGIYLFNPKAIEIINLKTTDIIIASAKAPEPTLDIVTVAIDEASVEKYGQWPWPRYRIAQLLDKISTGGAKSIGMSIIFAEPDRTSPQLWQKTLQNEFGYSVDTSGIPSEILDHDTYLANILTKGPFVLGYTFLFDDTVTSPQTKNLHPVSLTRKEGNDSTAVVTRFYQANGVISNYQVLAEAVSGSGFLNGSADIDGVLRRLPLCIEYNDTLYPSFTLAVLMQLQQQHQLAVNSDSPRIPIFSLDNFHIPTDEQGNFLLGPVTAETSTPLSAAQILEEKTRPDSFRDKVVLVGATAAGLSHEYATPLASGVSLLDLHKYSLESLTSSRPTIRTQLFPYWETVFTFLLCLILAGCVALFSTVWAITFYGLSACLSWLAAAAVYQYSGYLFSPLLLTVSVTLGCCLFLTLKFHYFQQQARAETGDAILLLKSSETSLRSILNTIPDIIFRLDPSGNITFISPAIAKYTDSNKNLLGRPIFDLVAPEDLDKAQYRLNERRTGERATLDLEIRLQLGKGVNNQHGTTRYFSLSAEGIYLPQNSGPQSFLGTQGIFRDITHRKRLEFQLIQAQKMEVIGNLAAGIAHDLNNILSGLVSYPDLLLLEIPKDDPLHNKIQFIKKSGKKAAVIVQDLLTLARRGISINEICNINDIICDYLDSVEFQNIKARHPKVSIRKDLQDNLFNITGSAVHLSKVIMNILINGLEAMPAGGDMVIATANTYVDTCLEGYENIPEGEYVLISVSDSGVGILKSDVKRIFEPFYTEKSMHHSGTGLGMTIVWATIKDHNGYIDIESEEGLGTTFRFYLPTTREITPTLQRRIALDDYLGSESVLVVDDISEQLTIARNMLTKLGYKVYTAGSGEQAIESIRQQPIDLVILNMIMPGGMDGLKTYQEIIKLVPQQKVIITSGFSESGRVKQLLLLGAGAYVPKPYSLEKLGLAVRKELDRKTE